MFDRRLRAMLVALGIALVIIVGRLGQLQIVHADYYRRRAERSLLLRPKSLPFVRGSILDRTGAVLVRDEPCWDLTIDYEVIAADVGIDHSVMPRLVDRWRRAGRYPSATDDGEVERAFRQELATMWRWMALFLTDSRAISVPELRDRAGDVYRRITSIRAAVAARRGFDAPVAEELDSHPIVPRLSATRQVAARQRFAEFPWVHVRPSTVRRIARDAAPFAHVLGRMGRVDAAHVANDPNADDPFASYRADEHLGITGVEYTAERSLRGRRGQLTRDREGDVVVGGSFAAEDGRDVQLTIRADLQRRLYELLGRTVESIAESSGGSVVVLDVASREILALVSYPSYDANRFQELYPSLRDDTDRTPLRFRAVANRYAPGSTVKPLVCLAGLMSGRITLDERQECAGYLFPEHPDRWRCWQIHGTTRRKAHGSVDVVEALTGSCNVFMYRLGEKLGVDALCSVFDMAGVGRTTGVGLREEVRGINPTAGWLMAHKNTRPTAGTARLFAIGQGELAMTPLQVANLMATYASGRYRHVTLVRKESASPEWTIPAAPEHWTAIRRGIFGVVNDPEGTAYRYAHFEHDRYAICGKTGSATAHRWPTSYRIRYVSGAGEEKVALVRAGARAPAIKRFMSQHPEATFDPSEVQIAARWPPTPPPRGERYSHAWFGGFLQAIDAAGQPDWSLEPRIAFAILVEFGGSGGQTGGPMAKALARELLDVLGSNLDPDA